MTFPSEPTRARMRAGSARQGRLKDARGAGRLEGRVIGALKL
jgi:hypothetical protein